MAIIVEAKISLKKSTTVEATVDTGFTGGIFLPEKTARQIGCVFAERDLPTSASGHEIPGKYTELNVHLPDADVSATKIRAFCPDDPALAQEVLLGCQFLGAVKAFLVMGDVKYTFSKRGGGGGAKEARDSGYDNWVIPVDRPSHFPEDDD